MKREGIKLLAGLFLILMGFVPEVINFASVFAISVGLMAIWISVKHIAE